MQHRKYIWSDMIRCYIEDELNQHLRIRTIVRNGKLMIFHDDPKVSPSDNLPILIISPSEMMILPKNENCQKKNPKNIFQKKERDPSSASYQRLPRKLNQNREFKMNSPVYKWDCDPRPPDDWFWNCSDICVKKEPNSNQYF